MPIERTPEERSEDAESRVEHWNKRWTEEELYVAAGRPNRGATRKAVVSMFPYPSGDLHMGHAEVYSISDAMARFARARGSDVLNPIAWDSFGLPAENAAKQRGLHPRDWTYSNIEVQADSFRRLGISFDWSTRFHTSDPTYYRWNQWIFLKMFERGLAYRDEAPVNWCPSDKTVLANEQVVDGRCERCGSVVEAKRLTQWFFRVTDYAQRLLDDMSLLEQTWPSEILSMQRNWIGRSSGAIVPFAVPDLSIKVDAFTTRLDTIYGVTFLAVAPDSDLAQTLCVPALKEDLAAYQASLPSRNELERRGSAIKPTGMYLGLSAVHPLSGLSLPIFVADYVLPYGTEVVMGVPAHDQRDLDFASVFDLPIVTVVSSDLPDPSESGVAIDSPGELSNSGNFTGVSGNDALSVVTDSLAEQKIATPTVTYRLRDWLLSRQRYWGTPIPIIHCSTCGTVPVPESELPVTLPETGFDLESPSGESPLATADAWVNTVCPSCGGSARRDTDTMDTFVDSSWYFLRYPNATFERGPFDPSEVDRWMPIDDYVGGKEHATGHLMYARFITKVLHDIGLVSFVEPIRRLTNQGQVIMNGRAMSKSIGNVVNLQGQIAEYGADAVRVTMLFAGPPEDDIDWADVSPAGSVKWLKRVQRLARDVSRHQAEPTADRPDHLAKEIARLIHQTAEAMERNRFNVAIAILMKLTNVLRGHIEDSGKREYLRFGVESLVKMVSIVAPYTAEQSWSELGHSTLVAGESWPPVDEGLLAEESVTCVIQINGKTRDVVEISVDASEDQLVQLARSRPKIMSLVGDRAIVRTVVKAPKFVNFVL